MSEPTAAAKRAAEAHFGHKVCKPNATNVVFVNRLAETIDRETGLPELIAALRWYVEHDDTAEMEDNRPWLDGRNRAIDALRKAGAL